MSESILINLWSDFYEDGYVPENEVQQTYMYVENKLPLSDQKDILEFIIKYIDQNFVFTGLESKLELYDSKLIYPTLPSEMHFSRYNIIFKHITHKMAFELIGKLNNSNLSVNSVNIEFISES